MLKYEKDFSNLRFRLGGSIYAPNMQTNRVSSEIDIRQPQHRRITAEFRFHETTVIDVQEWSRDTEEMEKILGNQFARNLHNVLYGDLTKKLFELRQHLMLQDDYSGMRKVEELLDVVTKVK